MGEEEEVASSKKTRVQKIDTLFMTKMAAKWLNLWPKRLKNHTRLWGRTYLYSPYKGVRPRVCIVQNKIAWCVGDRATHETSIRHFQDTFNSLNTARPRGNESRAKETVPSLIQSRAFSFLILYSRNVHTHEITVENLGPRLFLLCLFCCLHNDKGSEAKKREPEVEVAL